MLPRFIIAEIEAFLRCGILAHGFLRVRCEDRGDHRLVASSRKRRGFCPSCIGRRMSDTLDGVYARERNGRIVFHPVPAPTDQDIAAVTERVFRVVTNEMEAGHDDFGARCAQVEGFNLHANVRIAANDRAGLETLCRYMGRPPLSADRLTEIGDGKLALRLKRPWSDGTTHLVDDSERNGAAAKTWLVGER